MDLLDILKVAIIAASPVSELRGAIPVAILVYDFPWLTAYFVAVIGNILPVPFILLFLNFTVRQLSKIGFFDKLFQWFFSNIRPRNKLVLRYERIGLALFVAVPLPITGAWTGSIIAVLLGLRFRFALLSIVAGILLAGVVVTVVTMLGWTLFSLM
jgi:uncharacterized membrane protein